jgi:hypothetical protein
LPTTKRVIESSGQIAGESFHLYYAACAISRINPDEGMRPIVGYMIALLIGTIIASDEECPPSAGISLFFS